MGHGIDWFLYSHRSPAVSYVLDDVLDVVDEDGDVFEPHPPAVLVEVEGDVNQVLIIVGHNVMQIGVGQILFFTNLRIDSSYVNICSSLWFLCINYDKYATVSRESYIVLYYVAIAFLPYLAKMHFI